MRPSSWIAFNAFLQKCPPDKREHLSAHLPENDRKLIQALPKTKGDPTQGIDNPLEQIHFSWFAPYLRNLTERDIRFFISALSEQQAAGLKKSLLFSGTTAPLRDLAKKFLQMTLLQKVSADQTDLLPVNFLPDSPLLPLLELKLADLNSIVDYLGLHDLAVEMRQIIDKAKLESIYKALSSEEQNYLKILLQSREPIAFSRMGLANWKGDADSLKTMLRQRGVNRLAKALYGQHSSFIWHLCHRLDTDRAVLLQKLITPLENSGAIKLLISQIVELLSYKGSS